MHERTTIAELGEFGLIERIRRLVESREGGSTAGPPRDADLLLGIGDDAAVLRPEPGWDLVVTCDAQVAGRHFLPRWMSARTIGRRAMTVNLSDIAAMGAEPRHALVSLGLPSTLSVSFVDGLYDGFLDALQGSAARIIGGNLTGAGPDWFCDITLIGRVETGSALRRDGARPGDRIFCTGSPGRAAAGLTLLREIERRSGPPHPDQKPGRAIATFESEHPWSKSLLHAFLEPNARLRAGRMLAGLKGVAAVVDLRDGVVGALTRICERSDVSARIDPARFPSDPDLEAAAAATGSSRVDWTLSPGDDYELLFVLRPDEAAPIAREIAGATGIPVTEIGEIIAPDSTRVTGIEGWESRTGGPRGWDHFRG